MTVGGVGAAIRLLGSRSIGLEALADAIEG
jgi:hypothetical protein